MSKVTKGGEIRRAKGLSLRNDATCIIIVNDPFVEPYRPGSQRARIWNVISLMNGLTVVEAHQILVKLEPNVHGGRRGSPLGWVAHAISRGLVKIEPGA